MLSNIAVIAKIKFNILTLTQLDKKTSHKVNADFLSVSDQAGGYFKVKLTRNSFRGLFPLIDQIRKYFRKMTSPFGDDESRILPVTMVMEFTREMGRFKREFETIRETVKAEWDAILSEQKQRLGHLFDETKYPTSDSLDDKLNFKWELIPVPDWALAKGSPDHALFKLEKTLINQLTEKIQEEEKDKILNAQLSLWDRLLVNVMHVKEICLNGERIRHGFLKTLPEDVKLIPRLNIAQDPDLDTLCREIEESFLGWELKQVQKDKDLRRRIGLRAEKIVDKILTRIQTGIYPKETS